MQNVRGDAGVTPGSDFVKYLKQISVPDLQNKTL